jgi:glycosyltransferase involved in cell wall biosynthesis
MNTSATNAASVTLASRPGSRRAAGRRLLSINNYFYRRGGAEIIFLEQNRLFDEIGWEVIPFCMHHRENLPTPWDRFFAEEIEFGRTYNPLEKIVRAAKVTYSLEARRKLRKLVLEARPQLAHAHNVYHHLSPAILSTLKHAEIPTVLSLHDLKIACPAYNMLRDGRPCESCRGGHVYNVLRYRCIKDSSVLSAVVLTEAVLHRLLRTYERNVDRFVVPSRFYIEKLVDWGWSRDRFVHIPNFVDVERLRPQGNVGHGFLYMGRLSAEKGLRTLLRAAAACRQPITLAGAGPQEHSLRQLAATLGADVRFLGHQTGPALHAAVAAARAVVLPSEWYENAPVSVLEAYALGRPVIGAAIGGIPELVREGETGATFPAGDAEALCETLVRFAAMPPNAVAAMSRAGRQWVERDFSAAMYRERLLALYENLLAELTQ